MDGRMDIRKNGQIISPFYRTLSPIGAAALLPLMKTADHSMYLMPLGDWCSMCYKEKKLTCKVYTTDLFVRAPIERDIFSRGFLQSKENLQKKSMKCF